MFIDGFPSGTTIPAMLPNPLESPMTVPALTLEEELLIIMIFVVC